jgi:hypothetical protein
LQPQDEVCGFNNKRKAFSGTIQLHVAIYAICVSMNRFWRALFAFIKKISSERVYVMTLAELFQTKDVMEECRKNKAVNVSSIRLTAEFILKNGERRFFRCRSYDQKSAIQEILLVVKSLEEITGESVLWRMKGENTYRMGCQMPLEFSTKQKLKNFLFDFFGLAE